MAVITIWHNPRCSKSREALALVEASGQPFTTRKYLEESPSVEELRAVRALLGLRAIEMMRTKEKLFAELGLSKDDPSAKLFAAMADNPKLIERPILLKDGKALIARPPERLHELL